MTWLIPIEKHLRNGRDVNSVSCPKHTSVSKCTARNGLCGIIWPPEKGVVRAAIWSDPTCSALREALKRPIVNPKLKIALDVYFATVNFGSDAPQKRVANNKKLEGIMGLTTICIGCYILGSLAQQDSMGFSKLWVISKNPVPKKVFLPLVATCCQSSDRCTVNSNCLSGSRHPRPRTHCYAHDIYRSV